MSWLMKLVTSSVGMKILMATTGVILVGFLFGHMIGNWQIFAGQDTLNTYAAFLHSKPSLLWVVRAGMITAFLTHIVTSLLLTLQNQSARPVAYAVYKPPKSGFTSRWMFVTGLVVLGFVLFHLLHLTTHTTNPEYDLLFDPQGRPDVYSMLVLGFMDQVYAGFYIVAMIAVGFHLNHAVSSMFQSLGLNGPTWEPVINKLGPAAAILLVLGNIAMPVAVQLGYITLPPGVQ